MCLSRLPDEADWIAASDELTTRWTVTLGMDVTNGDVPRRVKHSTYTRPQYVDSRATVCCNVLDLNVGKDENANGMIKMIRDEVVEHLKSLFGMVRDAGGRWVIELDEFYELPFVTVAAMQDGKCALSGLKWLLPLMRDYPNEFFVYVKCKWALGLPEHSVPLVRLGITYWHFDRNMSQYIGRASKDVHLTFLHV
jgi:hypothetical protein